MAAGFVGLAAVVIFVSLQSKAFWLLCLLPFFAASIYFLLKYPEITFGFFILAGSYKAMPYVSLPAIVDLTVLLGVITALGILLRIIKGMLKRKLSQFAIPRELIIPYIALALLMFTSLTYTSSLDLATDKFLRFIVLTTLATFAPIFIFHSINSVRRFLYVLVFISSTMSIVAIVTARVLKGFGFHSALGSNYLALGRVTGVSILALSLYLISAARTRLMKLIGCALVGLNLFGLLYSGGKGPLLTLVVAMLAVLVFHMNRREAKRYIVVVLLLSLATVVLIFALPGYFDTIKYRLSTIDPFSDVGIRESSASERLDMFSAAADAMAAYPILGTGLGGFSDYSGYIGSDTERAYYPHNIFLEIGSELGIPGLLAFIFLIGFCVSRLIRANRLRGEFYHLVWAVSAMLLYMLLNSCLSGDLNDNRMLFMWIGIVFAIEKMRKPVLAGFAKRENIFLPLRAYLKS